MLPIAPSSGASSSASTARPAPAGRQGAPAAQAVFCIDVRSEVFRRQLEAVTDDVDTIGFAGFFGFPIEYIPLGHDVAGEAQCPVLLTPGYTVAESVAGDDGEYAAAVAARNLKHQVRRAWKSFKMGAISCFSFVGPVGLVYLPKMFSDTYGLTRPVQRPETEGLPDSAVHRKGPSLAPVGPLVAGIPLVERVQLAEGALRGMSLTDGFAPLVLVAGHGASTTNNPYDTGLDCGACGGHTGEANAGGRRDPQRPRGAAALVARGIGIPKGTAFVAAQHDTTTDRVTVFDREAVPATHSAALDQLEASLTQAGERTRAERSPRMVGPTPFPGPSSMPTSSGAAPIGPRSGPSGLAGCRVRRRPGRHRRCGSRRSVVPALIRVATGRRVRGAGADHDRADGGGKLDQPAVLRLDGGQPPVGIGQQDPPQRGRPDGGARRQRRRPAGGPAVAVGPRRRSTAARAVPAERGDPSSHRRV